MNDHRQSFATGSVSEPGSSSPPETWRAEANPDLGYGDGDAGEQTPPPDPDKDSPADPPVPRADRGYGDGEPAEQTPKPDPDKDSPGDPPSLEVAEHNGR